MRADIHRPPPELGEQLALYLNMLDITRILRLCNGRYDLVDHQRHLTHTRRVKMYLDRLGVDIAGSDIPMLPLSPVHRQLHRMTVFQMKGLVFMQEYLYIIVTRGHIPQSLDGIAERMH